MSTTAATATAWAISDGAAGNRRQALALARALSADVVALEVALHAPWSWLAPRLQFGSRWAVPAAARALLRPPWPALAVGCGRDAAQLTRWLRAASGGATWCVQILDPRVAASLYDTVVVPAHDAVAGTNVVQTLGALNPVDAAWLADAAQRFPAIAQLPAPRTALLLGGPRRGLAMDDAWFDALLEQVAALAARDGGSILMAASRRTPADWCVRARARLAPGCLHFWCGPQDGENPYAGYLAAAQRIIVTPDSVNMLSEACATGKPVATCLPAGAHGKLLRLHDALRARGCLHDLAALRADGAAAEPLRELPRVVDAIHAMWRVGRPQLQALLAATPTQPN